MSTDKTLADVQPGGRVRLGDSLPPLPEPSVTGYGFDSVLRRIPMPGFTAEQMRDYARAALSAQPSPGGQGDAVHCGKCKGRGYVEVDVDVDDSGSSIGNIEACPHCALAARQPVGLRLILCRDSYPPLVAHSSSYGGIWTSDWCLVVDLNGSACSARYQVSDFDKRSMDANGGVPNAVQNDPWRVPGFGRVVAWAKASDVVAHISRSADAAPPAQAVDLEQFRPLASYVIEQAAGTRGDMHMLACQLLALFDSQAVGK